MTGSEVIQSYLQISDVMYQSLKSGKYELFEEALDQRAQLLEKISGEGNVFSTASLEEKEKWQTLIKNMDDKISVQMKIFKQKMEDELQQLQKEQGQVRKQGSVNRYNAGGNSIQGGNFDQLK